MSRDASDSDGGSELLDDRSFRRMAFDAALIGVACVLLNVLFLRGFVWWPIAWVVLGVGLLRQARRVRRSARRPRPPEVEEAARLRRAVEEIASAATPDERELLGDVLRPVHLLEERVSQLVAQAREIDAALALHDEETLNAELERCRARVEEAQQREGEEGVDEAVASEDRAALRATERQLESLARVRQHRERIDSRLHSCVSLMRALHLDLVELRSSDLAAQSATLRRLGDQVREVSRGVDAIASAIDDVEVASLPKRSSP